MINNSEAVDKMSTPEVEEIVKNSGKNLSKIETLYTGIMCFVANSLSSIALEVGTKSSLGNSVTKSTTFNAFFRRSYNLKIKILVTNVISGLIATVMLTLGDKYKYPYFYIPWLLNTMKGMALFEGPALLRTAYKLIPNAEVPAGSFLFITLLLFIEEIFLWNDVFWSFRQCWAQYENCKKRTTDIRAEEKSVNEKRKQLPTVNKTDEDVDFKFGKVENSQVPFETDDELSKLLCASTRANSSNDSINIKLPNSITENNRPIRNKFTNVTG